MTAPARWGIHVVDVGTGAELAATAPDLVLPTASVAKVFALVELAARLESGELEPGHELDRRDVEAVGDSGLWQHLGVDRLPAEDVAALVGSVSDNLATNVLLDLLGLESVQRRATRLASGGSTLHDRVRDVRVAGDLPTLSSGCARDWTTVLAALHRGDVVSPGVSRQVLDWLALGTDLSMVAAAFDLDPLAHGGEDLGLRLWNKTGTDAGVRADVGLVRGVQRVVAYAAICSWDHADAVADRREVLAGMRAVGEQVRGFLHGEP